MLTCAGCSAVIERMSNVLTSSETVPHWVKTGFGFRLVRRTRTHPHTAHTASRPTFTASYYHTSIAPTACLIWPNRRGSNCCQQSFPTTVARPGFSITSFYQCFRSFFLLLFFQLCQCTDLIDCSRRHPPGINTDRVSSDCPWLLSPLLVTPALSSLVSRGVQSHSGGYKSSVFPLPGRTDCELLTTVAASSCGSEQTATSASADGASSQCVRTAPAADCVRQSVRKWL